MTGVERREEAGDMLPIWLECLPTSARNMLEAIVSAGPMSREALAIRLDRAPHGGTWNTALKTLRDNELVVDHGGLLHPGPMLETRA